jgi:hypothetical protein
MFDARHPETSHRSGVPVAPLPGLGAIQIAPAILGKVGESFAGALSSLQRKLAALDAELRPALADVLVEVSRLEQFGMQLQELARMLGGEAPLVPERVDLAQAARAALDEWHQAARAHGATLSGPTEPLELEVNGPGIAQLLDLGIEYSLRLGSSIEITASTQGFSRQPTLTIRVQGCGKATSTELEEDFDEIHWLLFVKLARALGLSPGRLAVGETMTLTLAFPGRDESAADRGSASPAGLLRTAFVAGRRVLLLEPQDFARVHALRLMRDAGVRVDAVGSVEQARASLRDALPDAVVTGIPVTNEACAALLTTIRSAQPRLRVIELVDDTNAFAFSVPGSDIPARVSREDLERTLNQALSQELDAA